MTQESALAWYKKVYAWKEPQTKVRSDTLVAACFFFISPLVLARFWRHIFVY